MYMHSLSSECPRSSKELRLNILCACKHTVCGFALGVFLSFWELGSSENPLLVTKEGEHGGSSS